MDYSFKKLVTLTLLFTALAFWCGGCSSRSSNSRPSNPESTSSTCADSETGSEHAAEPTDEGDEGGDEGTETESDSHDTGTLEETDPATGPHDTTSDNPATADTDIGSDTETGGETETSDSDTGPDMSPEACRPYADLQGDALLDALYNSVRGHESQGYDFARYLIFTDVDLVGNKVECIYSGRSIDSPHGIPSAGAPDYFNAEHSWPQSQFDFDEPARSDLHQLFAADTRVNNARSNHDFADGCPVSTETSCEWACAEQNIPSHSCACDPDAGASRVIQCQGRRRYEVRPERRGDIARAHFYMVARYRFDSAIPIDDDDKTSLGCTDDNRCIDDDEEAVLRRWHRDDPVDDRERARNERIELYQKNRNPFVDCPALVESIQDF